MKKTQKVATSAFIYHEGKALIAQRAIDEPFLANHWENVGGGLEWAEHPEEGLIREVQEEAGLKVTIITPYHVHHYLHKDEGVQIVEAAYICDPGKNPVIKLSKEHQAHQWIRREELSEIQPMTNEMRSLIARGFQYVESTGKAS